MKSILVLKDEIGGNMQIDLRWIRSRLCWFLALIAALALSAWVGRAYLTYAYFRLANVVTKTQLTVFSPEFTELGFARIRLGMTGEEVLAVAGRPARRLVSKCDGAVLVKVDYDGTENIDFNRLSASEDITKCKVNQETWLYTYSEENWHFLDRSIEVRDNRVQQVIREVYFD